MINALKIGYNIKKENEMKITDNRVETKNRIVSIRDIPVGASFYAVNPDTGKTSLFFRTFNEVVDYSNPANTWSLKHNTFFKNYQSVDVEIVVTKNCFF